MPLLIDDLLIGIPLLIMAFRAARAAKAYAEEQGLAHEGGYMTVNECRNAVPVEPGLKTTNAMRGGYFYMGSDPDHVRYLHEYLDTRADAASGEDRRRILAFKALQGREGSTAAINTYDNQVFTWGTGWGGLGMLPAVMDRLVATSPEVVDVLAACGVQYLGHEEWAIDDGTGHIVQGKKEALEVIRQTPALVNLFVHIAKDPATRDAVTDAQLDTFTTKAGAITSSEQIATQALFNLVAHLRHWAPGYAAGAVEAAANAVPGPPSAERDRAMVPEIVKHFYAQSHGWIPDWKQMQGYVLRDLRADGLDVTHDALLTAANHPPTGVKTAGGCGNGGIGVPVYKTAGGCGNWDFPGMCINSVLLEDFYPQVDPVNVMPVKVVAGLGADPRFDALPDASDLRAPGFENAREVFVEPEAAEHQTAGGWGETYDPEDPYRHLRRAQGPTTVTQSQLATIKRGIVEAVKAGDFDMPQWTQLRVGDYDIMVMNEPLAVNGLRLPTSFDDAIVVGKLLGAMPITPVISDARFAAAKKVYAPSSGLGDPRGALHNDPEQVVKYNEMIGPNTGEFRDGFWKEVVLSPRLQKSGKGSMAQYGFKTSDTHMFEHGGPSNHFKEYKDYSDTPTYASRQAVKYDADGTAHDVDLLDVIAAGELGGPLPDWLVQRLRTGEVGA